MFVLTYRCVVASPVLWASFVVFLLLNVNGEPWFPGKTHFDQDHSALQIEIGVDVVD